MTALLIAVASGLAAWLALPGPPGARTQIEAEPVAAVDSSGDLLQRGRLVWAGLAGLGLAVFVPPMLAVPGFVVGVVGCLLVIGRAEPAEQRRRRERAERELPHLVGLLGAALRAGLPPGRALRSVCTALPGPAADALQPTLARLELGVDPEQVWSGLARDPVLAPLGRALARAHRSGASVADAVDRLAEELDRLRRGRAEDAARTVGVRAAVPLGLCLLPAFLLLGVVPTVAALLTTVTR